MKTNKFDMGKLNFILRTSLLVILIFGIVFLCVTRLFKLQIVDGPMYSGLSQKNYTASQSVQAARGQITDSKGKILNTNKIVYKVIIQRAFFPAGSENEIIHKTLSILASENEKWIDSVSVTAEEPFAFTGVSDAELDAFKLKLGLNVDATVENCILALKETFGIAGYSEREARLIAGVRYEMYARDFSQNNRYTMCEDISLETVVKLKEKARELPGVDIVEEPMRIYLDGNTSAHTRGTIGPVSAEEYSELKSQGYSLNDIIGKSGIESAMESVLRGVNGTRVITRNSQGEAVGDEITSEVKPGNSVRLTIDGEFQKDVQTILENHISWLHTIDETLSDPYYRRGQNTEGGSIAVLDMTGKVLALANYPTYDINDYVEDYASVLNAELNPLINRATTGLYRPGSTFKTITGTAGLFHGIIDRNTIIICNGKYTYFDDYQPKCTGVHGSVSLVYGLQQSCNIYFYEVGRRLGIDSLSDVAARFGIGTDLGLETGGATGRMTSAESFYEATGLEISGGDTIQAAIGQSETLITPLHLAVQATTLANNGVRYKPYLVDSVWDYNFENLIFKTEPTVADSFAADKTEIFADIREGMVAVTKNIVWPPSRMDLSHFDYLPSKAAVKTGSPEVGDGTFHSAVMGYYPAENPVIAFGVMVENSDFSRYLIRNIIDAYFYDAYEPDVNEKGQIASPWKRWSEEKAERLTGIY